MDRSTAGRDTEPSIDISFEDNEADTEFLVSPRPIDVGVSINEMAIGNLTILDRIRMAIQTCSCVWIQWR
jgi:hypothetical protein